MTPAEGDGVQSCTPSPVVETLPQRYTTLSRQGPLVCDVEYSHYAPGYTDDPTGASDTTDQGTEMGIGSRLPVYSARDCMVACETSPGCASIVWSPTSYRCFLHGCPSQFTPLCTSQNQAPGSPGTIGGPALPDFTGPPTPIPPPCTLTPSLCPKPTDLYLTWWSIDRWDPNCTTFQENPQIGLAPMPSIGKVLVTSTESTQPVRVASTLSGPRGLPPGIAPSSLLESAVPGPPPPSSSNVFEASSVASGR
ncbi:hypothetical protein WJX84_009615 [Apatococcus fuscideae]|uniref:Apple domain-containing protein n=1 Tax=Apatococcus fuscideae TaxID=2026836 RepID=A0AAW1SIT5_9CHLO